MQLILLSAPALALGVRSPLVQRLQAGRASSPVMQHSKGWDGFGKGPFKYYSDFNSFMNAFEDEEDRAAYPEMFALPPGVYEVETPRPLGIAAAAGVIRPGDILLATTACKEIGPRYERKLL